VNDSQLLPDLDYNDNMTILFVHNGPFLPFQPDDKKKKRWSLQEFLKQRALISNSQP